MKILVPIDGSENSMEAVKVALKYAKVTETDIYLMTVIPFISGLDLELTASAKDSLESKMKARGEEILKQARDILSAEGVTAKTVILSAVSVADEIINFAETERVDLIIIGSRGIGGSATRFLMGSVASKVATHAPCSVYIARTV